jgi:hypothetical protein
MLVILLQMHEADQDLGQPLLGRVVFTLTPMWTLQ